MTLSHSTDIIVCNSVSFSYDKTPVLENVNLRVKEGEFVGIFGPNGGGKTTLLRLLMGFLRPSKGTISLLGLPPEQALSQMGYVPQIARMDKQFPITVLFDSPPYLIPDSLFA